MSLTPASRRVLVRATTGFLALLLSSGAFAQGLPTAPPESVGLSPDRLDRLSKSMQAYIDAQRDAGIVTIVVRQGKVAQLSAYGKRDIEANAPMKTDTIFRIASMSKAITSVGVMMLMEEGRLLLQDPVSKYIPSFQKTTVMVPPPAGAVPGTPVSVVPAKREITIRDLLTHTAGIGYGSGPAEAQYKAAKVFGFYFADKAERVAAVIDRLAALPFDAQPGERFVYGYNSDILGVVIEKVSGMSLDEFFKTRIFEPLKMTDSSFFLPADKRDRLAAVYSLVDGKLQRAPNPGLGQGDYVDGPRMCYSGGAGILSTASDYARLLQMLLNGGELDGVRLLSPKTVELMTQNHVGALFNEGKTGFGLGFEILEDPGTAGVIGSPGVFSWGGAYHTVYWADPKEKLVAVLMTQLLPATGSDLNDKFRVLVYQAIVGPALPASTRK